MSAQDRDGFPEEKKWEFWKSGRLCKVCHQEILNGELEDALQKDETYICLDCQRSKEKLEKE